MRTHRTHAVIAPWSTATPILDAARLAVVRVEPVRNRRRAGIVLDLCLSDGAGLTVIPLVLVEPAAIVDRDRDPLIFPHGTPGDDAFTAALAERVLPHLERLVCDGAPWREHVLTFAPVTAFDAARAAGCFGAAPLREALARVAPYRYARRFTRGRAVRIDASDAAGGWAVLRDASTGGIVAGCDPTGEAWYGAASPAPTRADVAIVGIGRDAAGAPCVLRVPADGVAADLSGHVIDVVDPCALDTGIVFDPAEGPVRRWFAVETAAEPHCATIAPVAAPRGGGSSGRIAVVLGRRDAAHRRAADSDEADALAAALRAEGFDAAVTDDVDPADVDLVHLIGTREGRRARAVVDAARKAGIPVAVHAYEENAEHGGWWGAEVTRHCFEYGADERDVTRYLAMLARRAVSVGEARADLPYAPAGAAPGDAAAALRDATIVFAASGDEAEAIRRRSGRRGPVVVVPPVIAHTALRPVAALVGADPFVLAHAPIAPPANQLLLARCANEAGLPLVIAGPVVDAAYLERVREFGGPGLVVLPFEPEPGTAAALRAAAAVVADVAWVGEGPARLAAAAATGARLVIADRRPFAMPGTEPRRVDPADAKAVTRALGEAWDEALRSPNRAGAAAHAAGVLAGAPAALLRAYASAAAGAAPAGRA